MNRRTASALIAFAALVAGVLTASTAVAIPAGPARTAPVPAPAPAPVAPPITGTFDGPLNAAADGVRFGTAKDATIRVFELRYPVGAVSGWHYHPGVVIALVRSGSVQRQSGCVIETFDAGEAFTEVGDHNVRNAGSVEALLEITQVYPASSVANRFEAEAPRCPQGVSYR